VTLLGVAVERKQKRNEGEKGEGSATTRRRTTLRGVRSRSEPIKTLTKAPGALFSVTIVYATFNIPYASIGFVIGDRLPTNDRHGDNNTTYDAPRIHSRSEPIKTLTKALDALFFVNIVYATFTLPYSSIGFVIGDRLPANDRHGDRRTTIEKW
jgi:hypothetical protein